MAQTSAVRRIGDLSLGAPEAREDVQLQYDPLSKLGWIEGKNLHVERRYANGKVELLRPMAEELVRLKVEVILTSGTAAALAAKSVTDTVPIVFGVTGDPVRTGIITSLGRPGGNVTGFSIVSTELTAKRLSLLRELLPAVRRVGVLENDANPYFRVARNDVEDVARTLGIQPIFVQVTAAGELASAVAEVARRGAQALLISPDFLFYDHRTELMDAALKHALPTMTSHSYVQAGGLIGYSNSISEQEDRIAALVDKILRGARPGDIPVEQPTKFELLINLKTAKALGITVPQGLLLRADGVIQ
jgi:putative ABC transport system substrate-binding protein